MRRAVKHAQYDLDNRIARGDSKRRIRRAELRLEKRIAAAGETPALTPMSAFETILPKAEPYT